MERPGALTFSAFFAASASERLSKLTKPTGCGGRRGGTINQAGGEQRGDPHTGVPGTSGAGGGWERGVGCLPCFERLLPAWR